MNVVGPGNLMGTDTYRTVSTILAPLIIEDGGVHGGGRQARPLVPQILIRV